MRTFIALLKENRAALRKFFVAAATALAMVGTVWSDGVITGQDWIVVGLSFLGAIGVYGTRNADIEPSLPLTMSDRKNY